MLPDFKIGEYVRTLSVDEVRDRHDINQGFGRPGVEFKPFICIVTDKKIIMGEYHIMVRPVEVTEENKHVSNTWLDQYIFESYTSILRDKKLNLLLNKS
jgi:hypothetical protein